MTDQYYFLELDDPAIPAISSFSKMYVGSFGEIQTAMERLAKTNS